MDQFKYIHLDKGSKTPKYQQIADSILGGITNGNIQLGDQIPSINSLSEYFDLSRDTVDKAYRILKTKKVIVSVRGKGFYVAKTNLSIKTNVLFLINKLSTYKMEIYNAFTMAIGSNSNVDLHIYHCDSDLFINILTTKQHLYDYFVIMPHFKNKKYQHCGCTKEVLEKIESLPQDHLIILDRNIEGLSDKVGRIYQDFKNDLLEALTGGIKKIKKYKKLFLVFPRNIIYPYPLEIVSGFQKFCTNHQFDFEVLDKIREDRSLLKGDLFIVISEEDLVTVVQQARNQQLKPGGDIGIICYNETPLKALLGISVISTNFKKMGQQAADMIAQKWRSKIKNEFVLIDRNSI